MKIPDLKMQDVGGARLPYLHYDGGTPQIIFVHATGFMPWLWHPVINEFVPKNSAWAPFICDYRDCNPQAGGLSWETISRDLSVFCSSLKIENPLIILKDRQYLEKKLNLDLGIIIITNFTEKQFGRWKSD